MGQAGWLAAMLRLGGWLTEALVLGPWLAWVRAPAKAPQLQHLERQQPQAQLHPRVGAQAGQRGLQRVQLGGAVLLEFGAHLAEVGAEEREPSDCGRRHAGRGPGPPSSATTDCRRERRAATEGSPGWNILTRILILCKHKSRKYHNSPG